MCLCKVDCRSADLFGQGFIAVLDGGMFAKLRCHVPLFKKMRVRLRFGGCASGIGVGHSVVGWCFSNMFCITIQP